MSDAYRVLHDEPDLSTTLRRGVEFHRLGQLEQAERHYTAALEQAPDDVDALHLLAVLCQQRGNSTEALRCITAALKSNPTSVEILADYAFILEAAGRPAEALAAYDKILIMRPNDVETLFSRGNVQVRLGRLLQAAKTFGDVVAIKLDHVDALNTLGIVLRKLGRCEEALGSFKKVLAIRPDDLVALKNCASVHQALDRHTEALIHFDRALAVDRRQLDVFCDRARSLAALSRFDEALASFDAALQIKPDHVPSLCSRGDLLCELGRLGPAIASYATALAIEPDSVDALCKQGNALFDRGHLDEALACFDRAVAIDPKRGSIFNKRGVALTRLGRDGEALASFGRAVGLEPENPEFNVNEGVARLRAGDLAGGWPKYERRLQLQTGALARQFESAPWRGESSLRGRTILLYAERDPGDTLQFVRYVAPILAAGARVVLEVQPELVGLMAGVTGLAAVIGRGEKVPFHDLNCPLPSLPLAFSTTPETIPAAVPYIRAPAARVQAWATRLLNVKPPLIGLVWTSRSDGNRGDEGAIRLEQYLPLFDHPNARFASLQRHINDAEAGLLAGHPSVAQLGQEVNGFADLAAAISLLDLVVTVDGPVAHLACALGRPAFIMLPARAHHFWMLDRDDSPWYPTAKLFRQPAGADWSSVIAAVGRAIAERTA
jgi:tetratricopeptide (TPR) repeat protein